jgi:hypothetical protein
MLFEYIKGVQKWPLKGAKMKRKTDFRNIKEARKCLYDAATQLIKDEKVSPYRINSLRGVIDTWLKAYNVQKTEDLEARIKEIEKALKAAK